MSKPETHDAHMKIPRDLWLRALAQASIEKKNMTKFTAEALEGLLAARNLETSKG